VKRVLVVDDAAFMRMIVKGIFNENGYEVVGEAANGRQAVDRYEELRPDLVTMDITMPEMDGIDAVKTIRANHPEAKILMVSAMGQQKLIMEALEAGAADFIVKPFQPAKVIEIADKCLADAG
jgi:two-component system chemotaxis response regulator CheY